MSDEIYTVAFKICQKIAGEFEYTRIELNFKSIPTYRQIHEAAIANYENIDFLEGFDSDDKPELYTCNEVGGTSIKEGILISLRSGKFLDA